MTSGSFSVTPGGTAAYSIPLTVPPGIGEVAPRLSIQFDSGSGNGYVGMRFSIGGLSQITRCASNPADDGLDHDPVDLDALDRFCLDGQKLVSATYGAVGAEYRTQVESFSRIESVGNGAGSSSHDPGYFIVRTKSGLLMSYGSTADSRITHIRPGASESTRRGVAWLLSRVADAAGNYMEVVYTNDEAAGEAVPQVIRYTGNASAGMQPHASVAFTYKLKPNIPSGFFLGAPQRHARLLEKIETFVDSTPVRRYVLAHAASSAPDIDLLQSIQECAGTDCFPPTTFTWQPYSDGLSFAVNQYYPAPGTAWKHFAADWNNDGRQDIVALNHQSTTLKVMVLRALATGGFDTLGPTTLSAPAADDWTPLVSDFNGDGFADVGLAKNYGGSLSGSVDFRVWYSNGSATPTAAAFGPVTSAIGLTETDRFAGDVNGDGIRDLVLFHASLANGVRIQTMTSNGAGGFPLAPMQSFDLTLPYEFKRYFGDFNGDGQMDLLLVHYSSTNGVRVKTYLNEGGGTFRQVDGGQLESSLGGDHSPVVADVNGDGNADLVIASNENNSAPRTLRVYVGKGDGTFLKTFTGSWDLGSYPFSPPKIADFNGDGLADVGWPGYLGPHPTNSSWLLAGLMDVFLGTAKGEFVRGARAGYSNSVMHNFTPTDAQFLFGDFNGDAETDFVALRVRAYNDSAERTQAFYADSGTPARLTGISSTLGANLTITYKSYTDSSVRSTGSAPCGGYPVRTICAPFLVVGEYTQSNQPNAVRRFTRLYKELKYDFAGRGLLGAAQVEANDVAASLKTTFQYRQDFPYVGMVSRATVAGAAGTVLDTETQYAQKTLTEGGRTSYFPYAQTITEKRYELPPFYKLVSTRVTGNTYGDDYGNLVATTTSTYAGTEFSSSPHTSTLVNVYQNDASSWRIGRLVRGQLTRQAPGGTAVTRTTAYEHDVQRGLLSAEIVEPDSALMSLRKEFGRDVYGNILSIRTSGPDIAPRTVCQEYDPGYPNYARFGTKKVRRVSGDSCPGYTSADHVESYEFDPGTGAALSSTDPNGLITTFGYDAFGRPRLTSFSQHGIATWSQTDRLWCSQVTVCTDSRDAFAIRAYGAAGDDGYEVFDRFQRQTARLTKLGNGQFSSVRREYNVLGGLARVSSPRFTGATYWTSYTYDLIGRPLTETAPVNESSPSGNVTRYEYDGLVIRTFDPRSRRTVRETDPLGNVVKITDPTQGELVYAYDAFDNISSVTSGAAVKAMTYDVRGRQLEIADPDMGLWKYDYDAVGELVSQEDAKQQATTLQYDVLGRVLSRSEVEGTTNWVYDTLRKDALTSVTSPGYRRTYAYHPHGALAGQTVEIEQIAAPPGEVTIEPFTATPSTFKQGFSTTLSWIAANAASCSGTGTLPGWPGSKAVSGSQTITVMTVGTFQAQLSCTNKYGKSASRTVTVVVQSSPVAAVNAFSASPNPVNEDEYTTLSWNTSNATVCTGSGNLPGWSGAKPVNGAHSLAVDEPGDYAATITCRDIVNRTASRTVTLHVNDCLVPLQSCVTSPVPLPVTSPLPDELPVDPVAELEKLVVALCGQVPEACTEPPSDPAGYLIDYICGRYPTACDTIPAVPSDPTTLVGPVVAFISGIKDDPCGYHEYGSIGINMRPICDSIPSPPPIDVGDIQALVEQICAENPGVCNPAVPQDPASYLIDYICGRYPTACDTIPAVPSDPTTLVGPVVAFISGIKDDPCGYHEYGSIGINMRPICDSIPSPPPIDVDDIQALVEQICAENPGVCNPTVPQDPVGSVIEALCRRSPAACAALPDPGDLGDVQVVEFIKGFLANPCGSHELGNIIINLRPICDSLPDPPPIDSSIIVAKPYLLQNLDLALRAIEGFEPDDNLIADLTVATLTQLAEDNSSAVPDLQVAATASVPGTGSGNPVPAYSYGYSYTYDGFGRPLEITYPSGFKARNGYGGSNGALKTVTNVGSGTVYWEATSWDPFGHVTGNHLGNGVQTLKDFDLAVGRVNLISAGLGGGSSVQSLSYGWDDVGNLTFRQNSSQGWQEDVVEYDELDRAKRATFSGSSGSFTSLNNTYRADGNIDTRAGTAYTYGTKPHAVATVGAAALVYDANGNLSSGLGRTYNWASNNLPTQIVQGGNHADFLYGPERQRVRQLYETSQNGKLIYYAAEMYEEHHRGAEIEAKHHIVASEGVVAIETWRNGSATVEYLHKDHLGSIDAVTNGAGQVVQQLAYDAFGKRRAIGGAGLPTDTTFVTARGYTGHEHLDSVGLIHMNGRVYDPDLQRFISADPYVPDPMNRQSHNRYSYTINNPLNRIDPSGFVDDPTYTFSYSGSNFDYYSSSNALLPGFLRLRSFDGGSVPADSMEWADLLFDQVDLSAPEWVPAGGWDAGAGALNYSFSFEGVPFSGGDGPASTAGGFLDEQAAIALAAAAAARTPSLLSELGGMLGRWLGPLSALSLSSSSIPGEPVYRVYGGGAELYGRSWTPIDPRTIPNYRNAAGLPNSNAGTQLGMGYLQDRTGVITRDALSLDGNMGGLREYVVPNPHAQIRVMWSYPLNPPY